MMGNWANCGNLLSGGMKLDATLYEYDLPQDGPRATYLQRLADILPAEELVDIFNQFPHTRHLPDMFWPLVIYLERKRSSSDTRANKRQRTDEMHKFRQYVMEDMRGRIPSELFPDVLQALQERDSDTYDRVLDDFRKKFNRLPYLMTEDQCRHHFQWFWKGSIPKMNPGIVGVVYRLNMTTENLQTGSFYYVFNQKPDKGLVFLLHADPPRTLRSSIPWVQEIIEKEFWEDKADHKRREQRRRRSRSPPRRSRRRLN